MGTIGCPETSVRSYHHTLHNMTEERRSLMSHYSVRIGYMYSTCQSTDARLSALQIWRSLKFQIARFYIVAALPKKIWIFLGVT